MQDQLNTDGNVQGRESLAVSHDAGRVKQAFQGAADKLLRALDADLGKACDARGRRSIRGVTDGGVA